MTTEERREFELRMLLATPASVPLFVESDVTSTLSSPFTDLHYLTEDIQGGRNMARLLMQELQERGAR